MQNTATSPRKPNRWIILTTYSILTGVSQMLWLNFAPLITLVQRTYGVSELLASSLVYVFPLLYVFLSIPAGAMIDRRGYKFSVGLGGILMAVFAWARIYDSSFWALLVGQLGIAIGQVYVGNAITKLAADWFTEKEMGTAMGLATVGTLVGMAVGLGLTPALVASKGLQGTMIFFALLTSISLIAFLLLVKENTTKAWTATNISTAVGLKEVFKNNNLVNVYFLGFLGMGYFIGLTTWLESILAPNGISAEKAGLIGGCVIMGGIVGSAIIPRLSDKYRRRKPFYLCCIVSSPIVTYPMFTNGDVNQLILLGALLGFFTLPGYALILTMLEELAGPERAGAATGVLLLMGNLGGFIITIAMQAVKGTAPTWMNAMFLLAGLLVPAVVTIMCTADTYKNSSQ